MPAEFGPLLDREYMGRLLAGLADEALHVGYCAIEHVHFKNYLKPKSARKAWLSVSYQLTLDTAKGPDQRIYLAKAFLDGRGKQEYQSLPELHRETAHYLDRHDMIVWCFPNDPTMPWLATMLDADAGGRLLPWAQLRQIGLEPDTITSAEPEVIHYRPEQRCLIRYRLRGVTAAGVDLYAKTYADGLAEQVSNRMLLHWRAGRDDRSRFLVARPLGWSPRLHTVWQQGLPITPLHDTLHSDAETPLTTDLAVALAGFHRQSGNDEPPLRRGQHYEETLKKLNKLKRAYPEYGARFTHLQDQARAEVDTPVQAPPRLVHNDLHLRQLGLHKDRIALFDFDEFRQGDPTQDLADLVVDLLQYDPDVGIRQIRRLTRDYARHCDWTPEAANLAWYTRNKLIAKAYRTHLQRLPRTAQRVAYLIEQARAVGSWDLGLGAGNRWQRQ